MATADRPEDQQAGAPVDDEGHHQHADQQDGVAEELEHGDRRELDDGGDVAVEALDEQAGAVAAVPVEVEAQRVAGQVEAEAVADAPGQRDRLPGDDHLEGVGADGDDEEHDGEAHDLGGRVAVEGGVDRVPEQHGAGHRRERGDEQHHTEDEEPGPLGPQVRGEQARIGARRGPSHGSGDATDAVSAAARSLATE